MVWLLVINLTAVQYSTITGWVCDSANNQPVEYANIILYRAEDSLQVTGVVTDAHGRFRISGVEPGNYYLEVSFIGFSSQRVRNIAVAPGGRVDLGRIALTIKPLTIPGGEMVGERPVIRYEIDKRVVEVSKLPMAAAGTAVDALENVPGVKVDIEGNVSLRGSRNFKVLVDGKPTLLPPSDALRSIPAGTIDRIEIITNPSVQFDPEGTAGIINVIMKRQRRLGWSALMNLNAALNNTHGGDFFLGYRRGNVNLHFGGDLHRRTHFFSQDIRLRNFVSEETSEVFITNQHRWQGEFAGVRGGAELRLGRGDITTLSGMFRRLDMDIRGDGEQFSVGDTNQRYSSLFKSGEGGGVFYLNADHTHTFDTIGHSFTAQTWVARRSSTGETASELLDNNIVSGCCRNNELASLWSRFKVNYTLPRREKDRLEIGYQSRWEETKEKSAQKFFNPARGGYEPNSNLHLLRTKEIIHSIYLSYSWNWRTLGLKAGVRCEYGNRLIELLEENRRWESRRWDGFPSAHIVVGSPIRQQITFSYSRRIHRPNSWDLQPYETWTSTHDVHIGNADLLPALTNSLEAGYHLTFGKSFFSAEVYWRYTGNTLQEILEPYPGRPDVILSKSVNAGTTRSAGGQLMLTWRLVQWLGLTINGNCYDYQLQGEFNGANIFRRSLNLTGQITSNLTLPFQTKVQLTGSFTGPTVSLQGRREGNLIINAAVHQTFFNRMLTITLRISDLFATGWWKSTVEGQGFSSRSEFTSEPRVVSLALSWNFNQFRLNPKMREPEEIGIPDGLQLN